MTGYKLFCKDADSLKIDSLHRIIFVKEFIKTYKVFPAGSTKLHERMA